MLCGVLAVAGSTAVYAAPPKSDVDVTITVIDDPAQLNERVNTISLPGSDGDDANAAGHRNKNDSAPAGDKANEAGESAHQDAANARATGHDVANDSAAGNDLNQ
jgi:hypothetical protein